MFDRLTDTEDTQSTTDRETKSIGSTRSSHRDERGISNVVSIVVLLGFITVAFTTLQTTKAPQLREETEFGHARDITTAMLEAHGRTLAVANNGGGQASVLPMGSNYPEAVILIQPAGPSGTLQTSESRDLVIENAEATKPETADYYDGSDAIYTTTSLRYSPNYIEYQENGDTVISGLTAYKDYETNVEVQSQSEAVEGRQLNLITTTGDISVGQSTPLVLKQRPLSASTETIRVSDDGNPIRIKIDSELPLSSWERALSSEIDPGPDDEADKYVDDVRKSGGTVTIELETGYTYSLNMARVGFRTGQQPGFAPSQTPDAAYITNDMSRTVTIDEGETADLRSVVRDAYNNPYRDGVVVEAFVTGRGSIQGDSQKTSLPDGTATFTYRAPNNVNADTSATVLVRFGGAQPESVRFTVNIRNADGS